MLGWRHQLILKLDYNEALSFAEKYFATVADSAGHLLSALVGRCCTVYQPHDAIEFPSLQGFQQSTIAVSPLHSTFCSILLRMCLRVLHGESFWNFMHAKCIPSRKQQQQFTFSFPIICNIIFTFSQNVNITSEISLILSPAIFPRQFSVLQIVLAEKLQSVFFKN